MREVDGRGDQGVGGRDRPALFASLTRPGFPPLYAAGFLFATSRWGLGFLAAYVANELTGSPRAVQLTGAAMWAPMLLAGIVGGVLADRADRRRILLAVIGVLVPIVCGLAALALTNRLEPWMLYPFMVCVGLSWVADMTSRRTLVLDVVGVDLIDNAMALESLSTSLALAFGVLAGGAVIDTLGVGQAFLALAALLVTTGLLVAWSRHRAPGVGSPPAPGPMAATLGGVRGLGATVGAGLGLAAANPSLRAGLGVTVVANAFFFSHTPLVPVFADQLGAGPLGAGLLASAGGLGMMLSALAVARFEPPRGSDVRRRLRHRPGHADRGRPVHHVRAGLCLPAGGFHRVRPVRRHPVGGDHDQRRRRAPGPGHGSVEHGHRGAPTGHVLAR